MKHTNAEQPTPTTAGAVTKTTAERVTTCRRDIEQTEERLADIFLAEEDLLTEQRRARGSGP